MGGGGVKSPLKTKYIYGAQSSTYFIIQVKNVKLRNVAIEWRREREREREGERRWKGCETAAKGGEALWRMQPRGGVYLYLSI